jgi:TRAP-type C4-dicarboxylate transport system permease small subunit
VATLKRLDRTVARAEAALAVVILLSMVLVASAQALFFNIAERDVAWARAALDGLSWADTFLQKGTLCIAFLGASLATHRDKHICIDVLPRMVSPRVAVMMRTFSSFVAGLISLLLGYAFFRACLVADAAVPFEYEVLGPGGPVHVCDAATGALNGTSRPDVLCSVRALLSQLRVPVSSGGGIAQLIVPLMLTLIGLRLLMRSVALVLPPPAKTSTPSEGAP